MSFSYALCLFLASPLTGEQRKLPNDASRYLDARLVLHHTRRRYDLIPRKGSSAMTPRFLFTNLCGAQLRNKPGQRCRAPALRGETRCRLHLGKHSPATPEGRAATRAGHAAYYAKRKAAIRRGKTVKPNGGRPQRWPIVRP